MIGLRKLLGVAFVAGLFAGLTGCGKGKGDLGAEREESAPVVRNEPVKSKPSDSNAVAAKEEPAAESVELDPKEVVAENVKADRPADREGATARPADPTVAEVKDGENQPAPTPAPAPAPSPAPADESAEQRAQRLLGEASRLNDVKTQANLAEAETA